MLKKAKIEKLRRIVVPEEKMKQWAYYSHDKSLPLFFQPDNIHVWRIAHDMAGEKVKQHQRFVLKFILAGRVFSIVDGLKLTLNTGECHIIFPFQRHSSLSPENGSQYEVLCMNFIGRKDSDETIDLLRNTVLQPDEFDLKLLENVYFGYHERNGRDKIDCGMALTWFLARQVEKVRQTKNITEIDMQLSLYDRINNYIMKHLDKKLTLQMILDEFNISGTTLRRIFHINQGFLETPGKMIRYLKLNRSFEWVLSGTNSIKEIAEFCGYSDQFTYSRAFKKITGCSPLQFRIKNRNAQKKNAEP